MSTTSRGVPPALLASLSSYAVQVTATVSGLHVAHQVRQQRQRHVTASSLREQPKVGSLTGSPLSWPARSSGGGFSGPLRRTAPCRAPQFPASASSWDIDAAEMSSPLARELAVLSRDEFGRRVFRFSRLNFEQQDRPTVHTYLMELLHHRIPTATAKQVNDYLQLANVAGFHEVCVQLFEARHRAEEAGQVALGTLEAKLTVNQAVIDSAYALRDSRRLLRLAALASHDVAAPAEASAQGGVAPTHSVRTQHACFAVVRCLWRCVCLHSYFDSLASTTVSAAAAAHRADADQAARDALTIYTDCVRPAVTRTYQPPSSSIEATLESNGADGTAPWEPARLLRRLRRHVVYDSSGDDGEMLFHQFCLQEGWLRPPPAPRTEDAANVSSGIVEETSAALSVTAARELFYSNLIETCTAGRHVSVAMTYYAEAHAATPPTTSTAAPHPTSVDDGARLVPTGCRLLTDQVPLRLVMVLQAARDNRLVVRLARGLLTAGTPLGISAWSLILISAGEVRASDVVLHAYHLARHRLGQEGVGAASTMADAQQTSYSSPFQDVTTLGVSGAGQNSGEGTRHGWEYLLQTSLNALSKCQIAQFEETFLAPSVDQGLLHCTDDFYYGCLLQDAHNALNPAERAEALLARMVARGVPLSPGLISRLLKLYLRIESAAFLPIYQHAVDELGFYRSTWRDELLLWADRRRYMLTQEDRDYVLDQIAKHTKEPVRDNLGGLRTQYALLEYDARVQPLAVFASTHAPPSAAPTIMDSRMHFLLKKPQLVRQGVQGDATAAVPCTLTEEGLTTPTPARPRTRVPLIVSPERLAAAAESVILTREPSLLSVTTPSASSSTLLSAADNAYRLFLSDLVEGLQRSNNSLP